MIEAVADTNIIFSAFIKKGKTEDLPIKEHRIHNTRPRGAENNYTGQHQS